MKPKELTEFNDPVVFDDPRSKVFECPHCNMRLQFKAKVSVYGVYELNDEDEILPRSISAAPKDALTPSERTVIESLRVSGVLAAFETAVRADPVSNAKDIERYLLTFIARAVPMKSPQFAIRQCLPEEESFGDLEMWCLNKTVAVLADGEFRAFLPIELVRGNSLRSLSAGNGGVSAKAGMGVQEWVKTRYGYVTGRGAFMSELRKRAIGEFANTGI